MRKLLCLVFISMSIALLNSCSVESAPPAPTITGFTPTNGVGGATVTITGTNFSTTPANNMVKFKDVAAIVTASTATSITTTIPATATTGTISVTVGTLTAISPASFRVDQIYKATLRGANQVPPTTSAGTGTATLTYNLESKIFNVSVAYSGLTLTVAHIHKGALGANGGVVFPFVVTASPLIYTSTALTAAQETDLIAGSYYVNLHNVEFPAGAIRGQLIKQ